MDSCSPSPGCSCATSAPPVAEPAELGRLIVLASPAAEPPVGTSFPLDAVTTLGRDVNNAIVIDDPFASAEHTVLTFRGRAWYAEDLGSTNGTFVNGVPVERVAPLGVRRRAAGRRGPVPPRPGPRVTRPRAGARGAPVPRPAAGCAGRSSRCS